MQTHDIDQMRKWSGANNTERIKYIVPTIKFSGRDGSLKRFAVGDWENGETLDKDVELVILRARRTYSSYTQKNGKAIRMFTNEHDLYKDHITIWKAEDGSFTKEAEGHIETLRDEYADLELRKNLYVFFGGEVHKLAIRGKARRNYDEYIKKLKEDKTEQFQKNTQLQIVQEKNEGGMTYYTLHYKAVSNANLDDIAPFLQEVGEKMEAIDEQYKGFIPSAKPKTEPSTTAETDETPTINLDDDGNEVQVTNPLPY